MNSKVFVVSEFKYAI